MNSDSKIYVAGHRGLAGSAIMRALQKSGYNNLLVRTHAELDLTQGQLVEKFFASEKPDFVFLAAAKVGGILANNNFPADFIRENLLIQTYVIDAAYRHGCKKLMFLGSSCIYPKFATQPIQEESLLTGLLEPTNSAYALAKIAGLEMCRSYGRQFGFPTICLMPTNLYGPGDNFDPQNSHVLPALIRKFHEAKVKQLPEVQIWGTGSPRREFLHVDDLANAAVFLMKFEKVIEDPLLNVGVGEDLTIRELAEMIQRIVGYQGRLTFDTSKPDGTPRKLLDVSKLKHLGWQPTISLENGISETYKWFLEHQQ
jgi:GDP-L-fucose synthase